VAEIVTLNGAAVFDQLPVGSLEIGRPATAHKAGRGEPSLPSLRPPVTHPGSVESADVERGNVSIRNLLGLALAITAAGGLATPAAGQSLERGEALFQLCAQCHGDAGEGNPSIQAPAIAGLQAWYVETQLNKFRDGIRGAHPDDLEGLRMGPMARTIRSDEDITALAAYVESLTPTPAEATVEGGDAKRGQVLFTLCGTCHGVDGRGNPALFGPALIHASDWYLVTQLNKFKSGIRGGDPKDQTGILMRPMSLTLVDDQAVKDVVAYIQTLPE
jgi:cytochrome c oxidase subunit 2